MGRAKRAAPIKPKKVIAPSATSTNKNKQFKLTPFRSQVYAWTRRIPKGKVATYASLAAAMGKPKAARAVGNALRTNPWAPTVPCHRVVATTTLHLNGYQGNTDVKGGSLTMKSTLLEQEGVTIVNGCVDPSHLVDFTDSALFKPVADADLTEDSLKLPSDADVALYTELMARNQKHVVE